jgi:hypothetical protein
MSALSWTASRGEITRTVSPSQILETSFLRAAQPEEELDEISETFFLEGEIQEASGVFVETNPFRGSLDLVPHRRWPALVLVGALLCAGATLAWCADWRSLIVWPLLAC